MSVYLTDTHPLIWYLANNNQLSLKAQVVFQNTDVGTDEILIPSIVIVEIIYLTEKKRIPVVLLEQVLNLLEIADANYRVITLDLITAKTVQSIDREKVPDLPDRIIVAHAKVLEIPLITKDQKITNSQIIKTIW
jgi:PIN domain nuclease of toxin-antitoxin system